MIHRQTGPHFKIMNSKHENETIFTSNNFENVLNHEMVFLSENSYFSAMYMDGQLILRKARGLLYQFRQLPKIPCTLSNLCRRCGPGTYHSFAMKLKHSRKHCLTRKIVLFSFCTGMWDSGHHPAIECIGHTDDDHCILSGD